MAYIVMMIAVLAVPFMVITFLQLRSDMQKELHASETGNDIKQRELQQKLQKIIDTQEDFEERLKNIELIVTDSRFVDLPDAKETINLKKKMDELHILLSDLKKD